MERLPEEIKMLRLLKGRLDLLMSYRDTPVEIRSNDLYDFAMKEPTLKVFFYSQKAFNQFLRKMHDSGVMKQIIPNYAVDTSNHRFYQWRFRGESRSRLPTGRLTETTGSGLDYYKNSKKVCASDGTNLRSIQEKDIYEQLLTCDYLEVTYEAPLSGSNRRDVKFPDFRIVNKLTRKTYYWEHFGMTDSEGYRDEMAEKLAWYRANGFRQVEDGGNLIVTQYVFQGQFQKDVLKYIALIRG